MRHGDFLTQPNNPYCATMTPWVWKLRAHKARNDDSSQSQLWEACQAPCWPSSGFTSSSAKYNNELTSGWELRSHCSTECLGCHGKKKVKPVFDYHSDSVCLIVECLGYNCNSNMWLTASQTTCLELFLVSSWRIWLIKVTGSKLSITVDLWHLCRVPRWQSTSQCQPQ